jgi:hypothetical protein
MSIIRFYNLILSPLYTSQVLNLVVFSDFHIRWNRKKPEKLICLALYLNIKPLLKRYFIDSSMRRNDSHVLFASLSYKK